MECGNVDLGSCEPCHSDVTDNATVLTAQSMTNKSQVNYIDNKSGLVEAKTVESWISDWKKQTRGHYW